jgi:KAP family P-loop domain
VATEALPASWSGLSPSVQNAFGWARAATPPNKPVTSTGLLLGILRAHAGYSEPEALLAHLGRPVGDLTAALKAVSPELDVDVKRSRTLSDLSELAPECDLVVRAAVNLAFEYDVYRDRNMHVPHLFGAILRSGPNAQAHEVLRTVLGDEKAQASDDYIKFLREQVNNRSLRYGDFLLLHPLIASSSLPAPPELFVGREREVEEILTAISDRHVVFVTGPVGIGKTALALQVVSKVVDDFSGKISYLTGHTPHAETAVQAKLRHSGNSLLILDEVDDLDIERLITPAAGPAIVITTLPTHAGAGAKHLALEPLSPKEIQQLLRARAPDSVPEADLTRLVPIIDGVAGTAKLVVEMISGGLRALDLVAESKSLLDATRKGGPWEEVKARDPEAWEDLERRYRDRQPHEQWLLRAVSLLENPFSSEQAAALVSGNDTHMAEVVLADLCGVGLIEEGTEGHWSQPEGVRTFARSKLAGEADRERNQVVAQALVVRHGIGLPEEPSALAGFRSDEPAEVDLIGFGADVEALCSVLIAHEVKPPISVGLFGDWGTGKSTFMRLMRDRIRALQADWAGRDDSPFCKSVKQITFNAWNYSDANLWASLVTKIFDGLAAPDPEVTGDVALGDPQRAAIVSALETAKATIADKEAQRDDAVQREAELTARLEAIKSAEREATERLGEIRPADVIEKARESEAVRTLGAEVLSRTNKQGGVTEAVATARELRTTWGFVAHSARLLGPKRVVFLVGLTLAVVTGVYFAESKGVPIAGTIAAVSGWLAGVTRLLRAPVDQTRQAAAAAVELLSGLSEEEHAAVRRQEAEVQRELAQLAAQRAQLDSELQEARSAAARAEREIGDIRSGRRITQFVEERAASTEYRQYLGLIALIRRDFDELTQLLLDRNVADKPPFDRIVLYIDDLDRCRADLVVQVLEAVHLLLALKLFVVVVGVDPRWLAQSLKRHYIGQLGLEQGEDSEAEVFATTPANYLEKIFQIPFALRPMGTDGFKRMVGGLFELRPVERGLERSDISPLRHTEETRDGDREAAVEQSAPVGTSSAAPMARERARELLRIWPAELDFIQRLGPLVPTPRAANRLANTYRLVRARQGGHGLSRFVRQDGAAGDYQVALVLLTVVIGFSEIADDVFKQLLECDHRSFWPFVEGLATSQFARPHVAGAYERLRNGLQALRKEGPLPAEIATYREWVPRIARYSFEAAQIPWVDSVPAALTDSS